MSIAQSGFTVNFPHMINEQARHIAYVIKRGLELNLRTLEATPPAEQAWVDAVYANGDRTEEFARNCTPGYYNNEGQQAAHSRQNGFYFGQPTEFTGLLEAWRAAGDMAGLEAQRG